MQISQAAPLPFGYYTKQTKKKHNIYTARHVKHNRLQIPSFQIYLPICDNMNAKICSKMMY